MQNREVTSQYSQNALGLYMLANKDFKYIYSSPDRREWLYRIDNDDVDLASDSAYGSTLASMREKVLTRFSNDGYTTPIDGDKWREFDPIPFPEDPQEGLLFQDPPQLQAALDALGPGYAREKIDKTDDKYRLLPRLVRASKSTQGANAAPDGVNRI